MPSIETQFERMSSGERCLRGPVLGGVCMGVGIFIIIGGFGVGQQLGTAERGAAIFFGFMFGLAAFCICGVYACYLGYASRGGRKPKGWGTKLCGIKDYSDEPIITTDPRYDPRYAYPQPQQPYYYSY